MFTKFDKAWVAALVTFLAITAKSWFGFEIDENLQLAIVGLLVGVVTYMTPNKTA